MSTEDRIEEIKRRIQSAYSELAFAVDHLEDVKYECSEFDKERDELQNQINTMEEEHEQEESHLNAVITSLVQDIHELQGQNELQQNEIEELRDNQAEQ
jgi:chromosome segregation ATPase